MTYCEFFDLFFNALKIIQIELCNTMNLKESPYINEEVLEMLDNLFYQDISEGKQILIIPPQNSLDCYKYLIPKPKGIRKEALSLFCPPLFASINPHYFYEILCNVLLEKSIVFISENTNLLTSSM